MVACSLLSLSLAWIGLFCKTRTIEGAKSIPPQLNGKHLDITVVADQHGFVNEVEDENGSVSYFGFVIDVLEALASPNRANFTYTLKSPSGHGSLCPYKPLKPYPREFSQLYNCAQSDVTDLPPTNFTTDMYIGAFYITPERQLLNQFTVPLYPPTTGTQTMFGTATNIRNFEDLVVQQNAGQQAPACVLAGTAYSVFLQETFPTLKVLEIAPSGEFPSMQDLPCDIFIIDYPMAASIVLEHSRKNQCQVKGKVRSGSFPPQIVAG
jgi:ABC-type amino acid transport substrate-binding protein